MEVSMNRIFSALFVLVSLVGCVQNSTSTSLVNWKREKVAYSREQILSYLNTGKLDPIEGMWVETISCYSSYAIQEKSDQFNSVSEKMDRYFIIKSDMSSSSQYLLVYDARVGNKLPDQFSGSFGEIFAVITRDIYSDNKFVFKIIHGPAGYPGASDLSEFKMDDKKLSGSTMSSVSNLGITLNLRENFLYEKEYPKDLAQNNTSSVYSGTGLLISNDGYILTCSHVISGSKVITVSLPERGPQKYQAEIVSDDQTNDVSILRLIRKREDDKIEITDSIKISSFNKMTLGERIFTMGYPLTGLLSSDVKYSEGSISSRNGINNDPRCFQVDASIQSGSSGGPLFANDGSLIGIIISTLTPEVTYQTNGTLPQNVNFALKSDYFLPLVQNYCHTTGSTYSEGAIDKDTLSRRIVLIEAEK
jgi:S1-C subfamily serine protease